MVTALRLSARSAITVLVVACFLLFTTLVVGEEHKVAHPELLQPFEWTYGCTPTAASMVLSYWDNYVPGTGKYVGMGKLIKYYHRAPCYSHNAPNTLRELKAAMSTDYDVSSCSGDGTTDPWNIDDGIATVTNDQNGYSFVSNNICWAVWPEIITDWCWDEIKSEIDAGRPFVWSQGDVGLTNVAGHSVAAFGYNDDKYVLVFNTYDDQPLWWYYTDYQGDSDNGIASMQVNQVAPDGWSDSDIMLDDPIGGETLIVGGTWRVYWYQWGQQTATVAIEASTDYGNTWFPVETVASPGDNWKHYDWRVPDSATQGARLRVSAYDSNGDLIAGDGSLHNFTVSPPCSDLVVQSIATNPVTPMAGQSVDVTVTIKNQGTCPASPMPSYELNAVEFYKNRDSAPLQSDWGEVYDAFGEIAPGGTATLSGKVTYTYEDTFKMWAQVDRTHTVPESNESNNVFGPQLITVVPDDTPTGSIAINGGATWTNTPNVTLDLTCTDLGSGCYMMDFYQFGMSGWTAAEPFAATKAWTLLGLGGDPVYVRFYDKSGNLVQYKDNINLDTNGPSGSIVINGDAATTPSTSVTLSLSCTDYQSRCGAMRLSNDNVTWTSWEALAGDPVTITVSRAWTLSGGEGTRSVYVQYRDNADNLSGVSSDTIVYHINRPPVASCAPTVVAAGPACTSTASINSGSSDPDGDSITLSQLPAGPYPLGSTLVTLTATDDIGASATCQATVKVNDVTGPILTAPGTLTVNATSPSGATLTDAVLGANANDNCSASVALTRSPSGNLFPIGVTTVTWTARDAALNSSTATQTVTVLGSSEQVVLLANYVSSLPINSDIKANLLSDLSAAAASISRGRTNAACNQLNSFINDVNAQAGKKIPTAQALQMIEAAYRIIAVQGCG